MSQKIKIGLLYFFLIAGGLWHILGYFQKTMQVLAGPTIIFLALWISYEIFAEIRKKGGSKRLFILWSLFVIIASFLIEYIGVKTGKIFGHYEYGNVLKPAISAVPVAIGFAWLAMLLSSMAVSQRILKNNFDKNIFITTGIISFLMVLFDFFMESAAIKLNYWNWQNGIPTQNFIAWFGISFLFSYVGFKVGALKMRLPTVVMHAFFGQLVYFLLVNIS